MKFAPSLFALLRLLILASLAGSLLRAQSPATGSIAGRVYEGATSRSLQGVIVRIPGTALVDYTDADGRYQISGAPAGTVNIEFEYVGLDLLRQTVTVAAGA